jgi:hypothetical protein
VQLQPNFSVPILTLHNTMPKEVAQGSSVLGRKTSSDDSATSSPSGGQRYNGEAVQSLGLASANHLSLRIRDPASWIRKEDETFRPPPSPIVVTDGLSSASKDAGNVMQLRQMFDRESKEKAKQGEQALGKVKELATLFEVKHDSPLRHLKPITSASHTPGSEGSGKVRELAAVFSANIKKSAATESLTMTKLAGPAKSSPRALPLRTGGIETVPAPVLNEVALLKPVADILVNPKQTKANPTKQIVLDFKRRELQVLRPRASPLIVQTQTVENAALVNGISLGNGAQLPALQKDRQAMSTSSDSSSDDFAREYSVESLMEELAVLPLEEHKEEEKLVQHSFALSVKPTLRSVGNDLPPNESIAVGDLDKSWRDFYKAVLEIVTAEEAFISRWHLANRLFVSPMVARLGEERTCRLVPLSCWNNIFRFHEALLQELMETLDELLGVGPVPVDRTSGSLELDEIIRSSMNNIAMLNEKFKQMEHREQGLTRARVKSWFLRLNSTMLRHADALIIAREFIIHQPAAMHYLETMNSKKKAFVAELEENPELQGLKFRDFLVQPVQNVCRYHLLYKAVMDKAPEPELAAAAMASQTKCAALAQRVNEAMKKEERKDAVELMARLKGQNNTDKFVSKLLPRGRRQGRNSDLNLNDITAVPIRQGELQVVSVTSNAAGADLQALSESLNARGKVTGLLCMNQLLLIESSKRRSGVPSVLHSFRFTAEWTGVRVQDDPDKSDILQLVFEGENEIVRVVLQVDETTKQNWLCDFKEVCRAAESVRQRELVAQQQMSKRRSFTMNGAAGDEDPTRIAQALHRTLTT